MTRTILASLTVALLIGCQPGYIKPSELKAKGQGPEQCQSRCRELGISRETAPRLPQHAGQAVAEGTPRDAALDRPHPRSTTSCARRRTVLAHAARRRSGCGLLRWLEAPGVRLVDVVGEWTCPVQGAARHVPALAAAH